MRGLNFRFSPSTGDKPRFQSRTHGRFSNIFSTCISNVAYDPVEETLTITFSNPTIGTWEYYNVFAYDAAGIIGASSRGEYFNAYIRDRYDYSRIS